MQGRKRRGRAGEFRGVEKGALCNGAAKTRKSRGDQSDEQAAVGVFLGCDRGEICSRKQGAGALLKWG